MDIGGSINVLSCLLCIYMFLLGDSYIRGFLAVGVSYNVTCKTGLYIYNMY
jgi:hypothetical protein